MLTNLIIHFIAFYQKRISPLKPRCCRFYPSCSEYAKEALKQCGFFRGGQKAVWRILKCHPFHPGGHDPVFTTDPLVK